MKTGDKFTIQRYSTYSPEDFIVHVTDSQKVEVVEVVKVLDEAYNLYLVKTKDGQTLQVTYKQ